MRSRRAGGWAAVIATVLAACSASSGGGQGALKNVIACASVNVGYVTGFTVTPDWEQRVVHNGLAASAPGIRSAAAQFRTALADNDQAALDAALESMEAACRTAGLGEHGTPAATTNAP